MGSPNGGRAIIGHDWIKEKAKDLGCSVRDLLALAPINDPFYMGAAASQTQAKWFAQVWKRGGFDGGVHLRRLHYWCVSREDTALPNGKPYENTEQCWGYICQSSKAARYLGLVPIGDIIDRKHPEPHVMAKYQHELNARVQVDTPDFSDPIVWINGGNEFNLANVQPYHLEVWVEKSTMNDVLLPICKRFRTNLVTGEGEISVTAVYNLVKRVRAARKPSRIFYISDFDPAGMSMPCATARKIEFLVRDLGDIDIRLHRLLLNREHVNQYKLPRTPIKESDRRGEAFESIHGTGAVELDALEALHPGILDGIVRRALGHYYSMEAEALRLERGLRLAIRDCVAAVTDRYTEHIEALRDMNIELQKLEDDDFKAFEPERAEPDADDGAFRWLYDSGREYLDQIEAYKSYSRADGKPNAGPEAA